MKCCKSFFRFFEIFHSESFQTGQFDWSDDLQGVVLGSFSYGYIASQILGGYLAGRFGPKKTVFCGVALSTVCTLLGPLASIGSPYLLIITQVLNGIGQVSKFHPLVRIIKIEMKLELCSLDLLFQIKTK